MTAAAYDLWKQAERAYDAKNLGAAEALYRRALDASPGYPPAVIGLSTVLTRRGAHRESHAVVRTAIGVPLEHPALVFSLGQRLRYFHEFEALERTLQDPKLAAEQLEHGVKKLGLRGAAVGASCAGEEFSDAKFHPFWAKAESLGVLIFIHPQSTPTVRAPRKLRSTSACGDGSA